MTPERRPSLQQVSQPTANLGPAGAVARCEFGDDVLHEVEGSDWRRHRHAQDLVGEVDQVRIRPVERQNECTALMAVGDQVEQSLRNRVLSDEQDRLVTVDVPEAVKTHREVAGAAGRWLPTDPGGHQLGAA